MQLAETFDRKVRQWQNLDRLQLLGVVVGVDRGETCGDINYVSKQISTTADDQTVY